MKARNTTKRNLSVKGKVGQHRKQDLNVQYKNLMDKNN
jgi:hypothetical protein